MHKINKSQKLVLSCIFISFSVFIFKMRYYPFRAQGDETVMVTDIQDILTQGHIYKTFYHAGISFQIEFSIILQILDYPYWEGSQWISPVVGAIFYGVIIALLYLIWARETTNPIWYGFLLAIPPLYIFASQLNRFFLTSHKQYTVLLFMIISYLAYLKISKNNDRRLTGLLFFLILALSLMNNIWGLIYGSVIGIPFIVQYFSSNRVSLSMLESGLVISGASVALNWLLQNFQAIFSRIDNSVVILVLGVFGTGIQQSGETVSGVTNNWQTLHFYQFEFPVVYIWLSGVYIIAFLSSMSSIHIVYRWFRRKSNYNYAPIALGISIGIGTFILIAFSQSDIDTIRRMSPLPGIMSVLYISILLSDHQIPAKVDRSMVLKILIIVLLISSVLAVPRMAGDGKLSPYDGYVNEREVSAVDFISAFGSTSRGNIALPTLALKNTAIKKGALEWGTDVDVIPINRVRKHKYSVIYSSGKEHKYIIFNL